MLRNLVLVALLGLFLVPAAASAQFDEGDWEVTLAGNGTSTDDFDNTVLSIGGSLGYFFNDNLEAGVRQTISFSDIEGSGSDFAGSTTGFVDYHFDLDRWQPFVGAFIGYAYGDGVEDDGVWGPEGGVKYFVNATTFIAATVQYLIPFDSANDEAFAYSLAIGFKF
ncbi:MAG: outer membrane beta-barrel protein [Tepidisphaeraceae bacterium]